MSTCTPSVEAYLERLPDGLDSYPDYLVKMSVVRSWVDAHDEAALRDALPDNLDAAQVLKQRLTGWVSEVRATVVYLTARDVFFSDDDAFVRAAFDKNRALLDNAAYRALSRLFSPQRISKTGAMVFGLLHRGIVFKSVAAETGVGVELVFPPHLVPPIIARCYATALQAALRRTGSHRYDVELEDVSSTRAAFRVVEAS